MAECGGVRRSVAECELRHLGVPTVVRHHCWNTEFGYHGLYPNRRPKTFSDLLLPHARVCSAADAAHPGGGPCAPSVPRRPCARTAAVASIFCEEGGTAVYAPGPRPGSAPSVYPRVRAAPGAHSLPFLPDPEAAIMTDVGLAEPHRAARGVGVARLARPRLFPDYYRVSSKESSPLELSGNYEGGSHSTGT
eukprot:gene19065-biopygen17464